MEQLSACPAHSDARVVSNARALPRAAAFWLVAATTAMLTAASSAPSPLYYPWVGSLRPMSLITVLASGPGR
jgi:hypothetical protein